jgi:hypothetical protein
MNFKFKRANWTPNQNSLRHLNPRRLELLTWIVKKRFCQAGDSVLKNEGPSLSRRVHETMFVFFSGIWITGVFIQPNGMGVECIS